MTLVVMVIVVHHTHTTPDNTRPTTQHTHNTHIQMEPCHAVLQYAHLMPDAAIITARHVVPGLQRFAVQAVQQACQGVGDEK